MNWFQQVVLITAREAKTRFTSKAFIVMVSIVGLGVLAGTIIPGLLGGDDEVPSVATVGPSVTQMATSVGLDGTEVADRSGGEELLRDGSVEAVIDEGDSPVGLTVVALEKEPANVINVLAAYPKVELLDPPQVDSMMAFMISLIFAALFMLSAVTFCSYVAQGVVEEKSSRIVEILLATTGARALMCGKIAGNTIVAFTCIGVAAILATTGLLVTGQDLLLGELGSALIWFVILFLLGFIVLAALYAGAASLVSRQEDVAGVTGPLMMLIMIPYVLVILYFDNTTVTAVMSYVPFSAPIAMPARLYMGTAQWWEPFISTAILIVTTVALVWLSSIVYERAVMRIGRRVALKDAIKTV